MSSGESVTFTLEEFSLQGYPNIKSMLLIANESSHFELYLLENLIRSILQDEGFGSGVSISDERTEYLFDFLPELFRYRTSVLCTDVAQTEIPRNKTPQLRYQDLINRVIKRQISLIRRDIPQTTFLGIDATYYPDLFRNKLFRNLLMVGRHYNVFTMITALFPDEDSAEQFQPMPPDLRVNLDCIVIVPTRNDKMIATVYKYYLRFDMFKNIEEFRELVVYCYAERIALVINRGKLEFINLESSDFIDLQAKAMERERERKRQAMYKRLLLIARFHQDNCTSFFAKLPRDIFIHHIWIHFCE